MRSKKEIDECINRLDKAVRHIAEVTCPARDLIKVTMILNGEDEVKDATK